MSLFSLKPQRPPGLRDAALTEQTSNTFSVDAADGCDGGALLAELTY